MIVLGADTHKRSHTIAAVAAATGELLGEQTVQVGGRGFDALLRWARGLDGERVWALEDCRHVSGVLERFLIGRGERVLRIPTHLSPALARALASAASPIRSTPSASPASRCRRAWSRSRSRTWTGPSSTCGCWSITANGWSVSASRSTARCSGICTISGPSSSCPAARCSTAAGHPGRPAARQGRADHARPHRPRRAAAHPRALPDDQGTRARDRQLVAAIAPQLLSEPGFGPLTAAKLVGEIAGAQRFATPAKLARAAGVAPIPASSGNTRRQRLDQGGNRQINAALHRVIVTRARCHPETRDYIARRAAEGKSTREAIRCLKRYLARHVWRLLQPPHPGQGEAITHQFLDIEATEGAAQAGRGSAPANRREQQRRPAKGSGRVAVRVSSRREPAVGSSLDACGGAA